MNIAQEALKFIEENNKEFNGLVVAQVGESCEIGLAVSSLSDAFALVGAALGSMVVTMESEKMLPPIVDAVAGDNLREDSAKGYLRRLAHGAAALIAHLAPGDPSTPEGVESLTSYIGTLAQVYRVASNQMYNEGEEAENEPAPSIIPTTTIH